MMRHTTLSLAAAALFCGWLANVPCTVAQTQADPYNQVVILIDASITYQARRQEAVARAGELLDQISSAKVHRWESAQDQITIVSLDAVPEDIWSGSLSDLKKMKPEDWTDRFAARRDYDGCTNVGAAFRLAVRHLDGDPNLVIKYLFAFSDLIDEPPTSSIRRCKPAERPSTPPNDMPWEELRGVEVAVFWAPPEQKLAWTRAVEANGLAGSFNVYSTSESAAVRVRTPVRKEVDVTEDKRDAAVSQVRSIATTIVIVASVAGIGIIVLGFVASKLARQRSPASRTAARARRTRPAAAPGRR
jgi:hypothetical protein